MKFVFVAVLLSVSICVKTRSQGTSFAEKVGEAQCQSFCREKDPASEECFLNNCPCNRSASELRRASLFSSGIKLKAPIKQCGQYDMVTIMWENDDNLAYFAEIVDRQNNSKYSQVTNCGVLQLEDLTQGTTYETRIWGFSAKNTSAHSDFLKIETSYISDVPQPVQDLILKKLTLTDTTYEALIEFTPAKDRACAYDVVWYGDSSMGDYTQEEITDPLHLFEFTLNNLEFSTNYSVSVAAKHLSGLEESEKTWLHFVTPSCLAALKNLEKCPPDMPQNLTVREAVNEDSSFYDVTIFWSEPEFTPRNYEAHLMNLIPVEEHNSTAKSLNISGNSTSAVFRAIDLGLYYQVVLTACSSGGCSHPAVHNRHIKRVNGVEIEATERWSSSQIALVIIGPIIGILLLVISMICYNYYRVKRDRVEQRCHYFAQLEEKSIIGDLSSTNQDSFSADLYDEWEINPNKLVLQTVLGEGAFGIVRRAFLESKDGTKSAVAIKMLKQSPNSDEIRQFNQEIEIMKSVKRHPYVVSLIGCITRDHIDGPLLVVEYCSRGDLQSHLRNAWDRLTNAHNEVIYKDESSNCSSQYFANKTYELQGIDPYLEFVLQPKHLLSIARQVALGMDHLAKTRVVHRDLAARNVLVCEDFTVKVSDFGLSRDIYQDNVYCKNGGGKLPVRWMALESLTHQRYTTHSDVWSYGVLLWEIVTLGATPYAGIHSKDLLYLLKRGYRLECPTHCGEELYKIMHKCWNSVAKDRPSFAELARSIEQLLESVSEYLSLENVEQPIYEDSFVRQPSKRSIKSTCSEPYIKPIVINNL